MLRHSLRTGLRQRQQIDYAQLANRVTHIRRNLIDIENGIADDNEEQAQPTATLPSLPEGVVQCSNCKMQFTDSQLATVKHNRHHPDCTLFDRNTEMSNPASLRYEGLLSWIKKMKVADLKYQLKKYNHKISGKKVYCLSQSNSHQQSMYANHTLMPPLNDRQTY